MAEFIYRFRSTPAVLNGFRELEKQEIYFAPPKQLNDPLEGYKDLFWKGDVIAWKNFLRHYVLCLMQAILRTLEHGDEYQVTDDTLSAGMIDDDLQPEIRKLYDAMCEKMFSDAELSPLPGLLADRISPIRRKELLTLLWPLHFKLFKLVCAILQPESPVHPIDAMFRERPDRPLRLKESFAALNEMDTKHQAKPELLEAMTEKFFSVIKQTKFILDYNGMSHKHGPAWEVIASTFPEVYLNSLESLSYGDWYTACFVAEPTQAAMWSIYGDSHRGVCLKFKTTAILPSGTDGLALNRANAIDGAGNLRYEYSPQPFQEVRYADRYIEIDFFRSLGTLIPRQLAFWFRGSNGAMRTGTDLVYGTGEWRKQYWESFHMSVTTKLKDWQHEREYRITLQSGLVDLSIPSERTLRYRFADLQGIVFGMKTTTEDKAAIARIIQAKCKETGRTSFEFLQAYYSRVSGRIATIPWDLVKFR
jgi:Protein of unknown function (DUF2971)